MNLAKAQVGEQLQLPCRNCKAIDANHKVVHRTDRSSGGSDPYDCTWKISLVAECGSCDSHVILERIESYGDAMCREQTDPDDDGFRLLPPLPGKATMNTQLAYHLPRQLRGIYRETLSAINAELWCLAGAGIRAMIEGICREKGIKDGPCMNEDGVTQRIDRESGKPARSDNLPGKIFGLAEADHITKPNARILRRVKMLGDDSVHRLQAPSSEELDLALGIVVHALSQVFQIDKEAEELEDHKAARAPRPTPAPAAPPPG